MQRMLCRVGVMSSVLAVLFAASACNKAKNNEQVSQGPPGGPPGGPWPGMGGPGRPSGPIGQIMARLTKGPQSLTSVIGGELEEEPPPWDKIQPQAKEYAELSASMSKLDPPMGSKESWAQLSKDYADSAAALEQAAKAKDKTAALSAHGRIRQSCNVCHRAHRPMRGPGGMGFPPGGFPPQGMPPGGPPGGPPRGPQP